MACSCFLCQPKPAKGVVPDVYLQDGASYKVLRNVSDDPNRITQYYAYEYLQRYCEAISRGLQLYRALAMALIGRSAMAKGRFGYYARLVQIPLGSIAHIQKCLNYGFRYEGESDDGVQKPFKWFCPYFMGFDGASGLLLFGVEITGLPISPALLAQFKSVAHRVHWWGHLCAFGLMATGAATDFYTAATYKAWEPAAGDELPEGFDAEANRALVAKKLKKRACKARKWSVSGLAHGLDCSAEMIGGGALHDALHIGSRLAACAKSGHEVYHHDIEPACTT